MVHATLEGRRAAAAPLQDGYCHLASGLPGCGRNLLPLRLVAEPASHAAAHAGFYRGDGYVDDLHHHAPHDTPVLLLALSGSQVIKNREQRPSMRDCWLAPPALSFTEGLSSLWPRYRIGMSSQYTQLPRRLIIGNWGSGVGSSRKPRRAQLLCKPSVCVRSGAKRYFISRIYSL